MKIQGQFLWINIIGGIAVLGGYVYALLAHPILRGQIWGGVPEAWRRWITTSMFIAAIGYCFAMYYLIFNEGLNLKYFWGKVDATIMRVLLILFLLTAAFWIHSTFSYLELPNSNSWHLIRFELWVTALSILLMTIGLATATGVQQSLLFNFYVLGLGLISFHCLVLDAILWISKFPRSEF